MAAVVLILGFKLTDTNAAAISRAQSRAKISPNVFPSPMRPQNTTAMPTIATNIVTQVLSAKFLRIRATLKTAAMKGMEAKITSVMATTVCVIEITKYMLLPPNKSVANRPFLNSPLMALMGLLFSMNELRDFAIVGPDLGITLGNIRI